MADELVCVQTVEPFFGVGMSYRDFDQTSDEEVLACLRSVLRSHNPAPWGRGDTPSPRIDRGLRRPRRGPRRPGVVARRPHRSRGLPRDSSSSPTAAGAAGTVLGTASWPRSSTRAGLATLLVDLLTTHEEHDRANVFDIELLARRLLDVTALAAGPGPRPDFADRLLRRQHRRGRGLVGGGRRSAPTSPPSSVAAAARTWPPSAWTAVRAPTLLIVGGRGRDRPGAQPSGPARLRCESQLVVVPGATHLFEEPGSLETVAALATGWFLDHLLPPVRAVPS